MWNRDIESWEFSFLSLALFLSACLSFIRSVSVSLAMRHASPLQSHSDAENKLSETRGGGAQENGISLSDISHFKHPVITRGESCRHRIILSRQQYICCQCFYFLTNLHTSVFNICFLLFLIVYSCCNILSKCLVMMSNWTFAGTNKVTNSLFWFSCYSKIYFMRLFFKDVEGLLCSWRLHLFKKSIQT